MINGKYIFNKLKDVKMEDYLAFFPMMFAILLSPIFRKKYEDVWLICEEPKEARDNGYHFFKYVNMMHPEKICFYAIKKKAVDYEKVKKIGRVVEYGSIKHWIIYFTCKYNISSQKGGKPNAAICAFMELLGIFKVKNVFLQHGIIINDCKWLYAECSRIYRFIVSTIPEKQFVKEKFGYSEKELLLTGMPRQDALHNIELKSNRILIMPTWRYWFNLNSQKHEDTDRNVKHSEYLNKWKELLLHPEIQKLIKIKGYEVIFYPHRNMQKYLDIFRNIGSEVKIASGEEYDIQELLKTSAIMITDYSSVFFDMVYMKKPVIFYQFDEEKYRKYQYSEGYFDYHNNPFGKTYATCEGVIRELKEQIERNYKPSKEYLHEHQRIFKYWDDKNSERIFEALKTAENLERV